MKTYIVHMQHVDIICLQTTTTTTKQKKTILFCSPKKMCYHHNVVDFSQLQQKKKKQRKKWTKHSPQNKCAPQNIPTLFSPIPIDQSSLWSPSPPPLWSIAWHGSAASKNCAKVVAAPRWPEARMFEPQMGGWKLIPGLGYVDNNHGLIS